jgi:hypothetical protein
MGIRLINHSSHKKDFIFKFVRDRKWWTIGWLFDAQNRRGLRWSTYWPVCFMPWSSPAAEVRLFRLSFQATEDVKALLKLRIFSNTRSR